MASLAAALAAVHAPAANHPAVVRYFDIEPTPVPDASVNGSGVTSQQRSCPQSQPTPVGGGALISGDESGLDLEIKSSSPGPEGVPFWAVQANNSSGSQASMTMHYICARGNFQFVTKNGPTLQPSLRPAARGRLTEGSALASCPRGSKLVGGGVASFGGDHATEIGDTEPADGNDANTKRDDAWSASVNNGSADTVHFRVTAVCARHGTYKIVSSDRKPLPDNSQRSASARCPHDARVTSGGVLISGLDSGLEVADSLPFDSGDPGRVPDDGWLGSANNQNTGQAEQVQVIAVCKL